MIYSVAEQIARASQIMTLDPGDVILTGSVHPPAFLPGKGVARTEFEGLGGTEVTIK